VELNLHSRVVKLVNCDDFTRNFLQKLGVRLNPPIQIPADPYSCERKAVSVTPEPSAQLRTASQRMNKFAHMG